MERSEPPAIESVPSTQRTQSRGHETRQKVLAAAEKLFGTNGYDGTSIADVAGAAGVGVGTVYHHFADKRAIFLALLDGYLASRRADGTVGDHGGPLAAAYGAEDFRAGLAKAIWAVHLLRQDHPGVFTVAWSLARRDPEVDARCQVIEAYFRSLLRSDIVKGQTLGIVRPEVDVESGASLLHDLFLCVMSRLSREPRLEEGERRRLVEEFAELTYRYLTVG